MYLVKLHKDHADKKGTVIHSPFINELKLTTGEINFVLGSIHDFKFTMNIKNPGWNKIEPLKTLVTVTDMVKREVIFEGRALQPRSRMGTDGSFVKEVTCESLLSYLVDSIQRHAEIHDTTVSDFLQLMLDNHNQQVEPHKQILLGEVTVTNTTDNVYRYLSYDNTYESIKEKLVKRLGGYIQLRREGDDLYLDYLEEVGEYVESTPIKLAHNMQSVDYEVDPTQVITRLIPLGETIESDDEKATDAAQARLTIESVNDGKDYLDDLDLQEAFGIIEGQVLWDDVTTPQHLKTNGMNFLQEQKAAIARFEVNSTNSHLIGREIASFEIGNYHDVINPVIGLNEKVQIIEKKIDINSPQKSTLKIGEKFRTLTEYQKNMRSTQKQVIDIEGQVSYQRRVISNLRNEIQNVEENIDNVQQLIEDVDLEELPDAINTLVQAISDLNDVIDDIPIYGPATPTQDGLMSKEDKAKLDLVTVTQSINLDTLTSTLNTLQQKLNLITVTQNTDLDAIRQKTDLITVTQAIDLDELYQDLQDLKNNN